MRERTTFPHFFHSWNASRIFSIIGKPLLKLWVFYRKFEEYYAYDPFFSLPCVYFDSSLILFIIYHCTYTQNFIQYKQFSKIYEYFLTSSHSSLIRSIPFFVLRSIQHYFPSNPKSPTYAFPTSFSRNTPLMRAPPKTHFFLRYLNRQI